MRWKYIGTAEEIQAQKDFDEYDQHPITLTIRKLVEQNGGTWTGTASDIIKCNAYLPNRIHEKSQQVGRFIQSNYKYLAGIDRIEMDYHTDGTQRAYTFTKSDTTNNNSM